MVGAVALLCFFVGGDSALDLLVHGEHRVLWLQIDLQRGFAGGAVRQLFHDDE